MEILSRLVVIRGWGQSDRYEVFFWGDEDVFEFDRGGGQRILLMYLKLF